MLFAKHAQAAPAELRYGPALRLTAEYVRLLVLNRVDRAQKRESFDFIFARPGARFRDCPTEGVLQTTSWKLGTELPLPRALGESQGQAEIFLRVGQKGTCSSRGILNFEPRQIAFTLDTEEGAFQYRVGVADIAGNVLKLPYVDEMNLVSPAARCEATVVDGPTALIPPLKAKPGSCSALPLGLPLRVPSLKHSNLADLDFRVAGVPFRLRLQSEQCPSAPPAPKTVIPTVDGTAVLCAYEELGNGDWALVASDAKLELLKLLSVRACTTGPSGSDAQCANIAAGSSSGAVEIKELPSGAPIRLRIGGAPPDETAKRTGLLLAAREVNVELGRLLALPWLRTAATETLVAPNPECAIDEEECSQRDDEDRIVARDIGWLCYPASPDKLEALRQTGRPLGLRVNIGSSQTVDVAVAGWSEQKGYLCPQLVPEGRGTNDSKVLTLTVGLVTTLTQTADSGPVHVVFTFLDHDALDRTIISGRTLELTQLRFRDRNSGTRGYYNSVSQPTTLDGQLCASYSGAEKKGAPGAIYVPLDRFALKDARDSRSSAARILLILANNTTNVADQTDAPASSYDWIKLTRNKAEPNSFCGDVRRLEFDSARDLSFQSVTLISKAHDKCEVPGSCATLSPSPGNYWISPPNLRLGFGVSGPIYADSQWPRHAVAAPGFSLHVLGPLIEVGRHLGKGYRIELEGGLRAGLTVPLRQSGFDPEDLRRTSYFAYEPIGVYGAACARTSAISICGGAYSTTSIDFIGDTPDANGKTSLKVGFSLPLNWFAALVF